MACAGCSHPAVKTARPVASGNHDVTLTKAQRAHIHLYTVTPASFRKTIETDGTVDFDANRATRVLAPFAGPVSRLLVAAGDRVHKGEALAIVESPDFAAAIGAYRKALATARTARRLAHIEKDLLRHHGISRREEDKAQAAAIRAEADRDAALQSLLALNVDPGVIDDIRRGRPVPSIAGVIRAPIAGTVVERLIGPGQLLSAGSTACFTIADLSRLWVKAQVFGADIDGVHAGDLAEILTGAGRRPLPGTVTHVGAEVDANTRAVLARVTIDNPHAALRKGMYVRVRIHPRHPSRGLLIPVSAVLRDDENLPFVYVAAADGGFARRHVTLGTRTAGRYQIRAGLRSGERIVVDGGLFLQFIQNQ